MAAQKVNIKPHHQLLVIGPLPPPLAGTSVSFKLFCDFVAMRSEKVNIKVVNTAPSKLGTRPLLDLRNLVTASKVLWGCLSHIRQSHKIILFGSNQFLLSMMPICLLIAKVVNKPFYVRSFGGSLDSYYLSLSPIKRKFFLRALNRVDGLIVQTESLSNFFETLLETTVHLVPGYRSMPKLPIISGAANQSAKPLKLVYVGHIKEQKGVFDLLAGIRTLNSDRVDEVKVECDFFGPLHEEETTRFKEDVMRTNGANYAGVLAPDEVISTITNYDLFVFPSYYQGEGHPGVLIEAMMAGLPIITTDFKSIPDLVEHGVNGLLVTPNNPQELADAIQHLHDDKELMRNLKEKSEARGKMYNSETIIPILLNAIEVDY